MTLIPDLQRDLVDAAARMSRPRQRFVMRLRLTAAVAAAAALVGATLLLVGRDASDSGQSSREPTGPSRNPPGRTVPERPPKPPGLNVHPVPGSFSPRVSFGFAGVRYSVVGFRRGGRLICTSLAEGAKGPGRPLAANSCAGERLLRRDLEDNPVRTFGGFGGEHSFVSGFARADVTRIALVAPRYPGRVVLSKPWSPEPWRGKPIRFFVVAIDRPRDARPDFPLRTRIRLQGTLTNGETIEGVP
jgi:hypothetical protein